MYRNYSIHQSSLIGLIFNHQVLTFSMKKLKDDYEKDQINLPFPNYISLRLNYHISENLNNFITTVVLNDHID